MPAIALLAVLFMGSACLAGGGDRVVRARSGVVASSDSIASRVGVEVLKAGGNAVDAAVAVAFALAVTYPQAGNIGGGGFMLVRMADGRTSFIDYREKAPIGARRDMYLDSSGNVIEGASTRGHLAAGVPGTVAGLFLAHRLYGTMSWKELVAPAHELASRGFIMSRALAEAIEAKRDLLGRYPASREIFLAEEPRAGRLFVQEDLAATLARIAEAGADGFYEGKTAELIASEMQKHGGLITKADLAGYEAKPREPVAVAYRGYEVLSAPLPSSGGIILSFLLQFLEPLAPGTMGFHSARSVHAISEAEKIAYKLRALYLGDEDYYPSPWRGLITSGYVKRLRGLIDFGRALPLETLDALDLAPGRPGGGPGSRERPKPRRPGGESEETTHFSIVDRWGNAVSNTYTLNSGFGSGVVVEGAGFLMNNEMDDFSIKPGHPNIYGLVGNEANAIEPGKRMLSSMSPTIVLDGGRLFMILGTPGGSTIPTTVLQVFLNVVDYGMALEDAVAAPRFHEQYLPDVIFVEEGALSGGVTAELEAMGHRIQERRPIGDVQAIIVGDSGYVGVSDPRGPGRPAGY